MNKFYRYKVMTFLLFVNVFYYALGVIRFGFTLSSLEAIEHGAFLPFFIVNLNQYWRLITANFVHFDLFHLLMNCFALYQLGILVEHFYKKTNTIIIVLVSLWTTSLIPLFLYFLSGYNALVVSGGFSGVLSGMIASILVFSYYYRFTYIDLYKRVLNNLLVMFLISLLPSISLIGHFSGFVGGFITSVIMIEYKKRKIGDKNEKNT